MTEEKTGRAAGMQIGDDQAVLMEMLVRAMGAKRAVEIGTFTGYSALAVARGLGHEGHLLCCDVSEEWTAIAREAWRRLGRRADRIADRSRTRNPSLPPPEQQFDFAFSTPTRPATPSITKRSWFSYGQVGSCFSTTCSRAAASSTMVRTTKACLPSGPQ